MAESAAVDVSRRVALGVSASKGSPDGGGGDRGAEKGKSIAAAAAAAAAAAGLGDVHAALGERVSGEGGADAAAHERREWEAMRGTLERAGEPNGGAEGAEGADSAAGFGPGMGHPSPGEFLGRGPGDAAGHASAAEAWYASAATDGTFDASDASSAAGVWRRYGALRNERGKAALREAAEMSSGGGNGERAAADFVLQCAETCYADASIAFEKAKDRVNAALVGLNRAQACRARAAWNLPRAVATSSRLMEAKPELRDGEEKDDRWRLREFEAAAGHCRRALQSLQPAAGSTAGADDAGSIGGGTRRLRWSLPLGQSSATRRSPPGWS